MDKLKKPRKITFVTVSQNIFLTVKFFLQNRLLSYAGACSFSFLFSFIPVFMLAVVVLVQFLHTSPEVIQSILATIPELTKYFSPEDIVAGINSMKSLQNLGIIIIVFILWMARRFFASVFDSFQNIFHTQIKRKPLLNQLLTFAVEGIIVLVVAGITFTYVSFRAIMDTPVITTFLKKIPQLSFFFNGLILSNVIKYFPNILIFAVISVIFMTVPGSKPKKKLCFGSAFLCTATFYLFRIIVHYFLNVSNYNLIYGVLGQVIITLMDIYFFFTFFLFFAQFMFVFQFFNELLLGELYLLPKREDVSLLGAAKLLLFIRPDYLLAKDANVLELKKGDKIYNEGEIPEGTFYVAEGKIKETCFSRLIDSVENDDYFFTKGDFFGEIDCVVKRRRNSVAVAEEDSKIIKIDSEVFQFISKKDPNVMKKLLGKISSSLYFMD